MIRSAFLAASVSFLALSFGGCVSTPADDTAQAASPLVTTHELGSEKLVVATSETPTSADALLEMVVYRDGAASETIRITPSQGESVVYGVARLHELASKELLDLAKKEAHARADATNDEYKIRHALEAAVYDVPPQEGVKSDAAPHVKGKNNVCQWFQKQVCSGCFYGTMWCCCQNPVCIACGPWGCAPGPCACGPSIPSGC